MVVADVVFLDVIRISGIHVDVFYDHAGQRHAEYGGYVA